MAEEKALDRLVFFSDAVIAIAITLLALDLTVPAGATDRELWHSVGEHGSDYVTFLISFAVIASFWLFHHWLFRFIGRLDVRLSLFNLVFLLAVVAVPFVSKILGSSGELTFGVVWYAGVLTLAGVSCLLMADRAIRGRLLPDGVTPGDLRELRMQVTVTTAVFLLSIPVSVLSPGAAKICWLFTGILSAVVGRSMGRRHQVKAQGAS